MDYNTEQRKRETRKERDQGEGVFFFSDHPLSSNQAQML